MTGRLAPIVAPSLLSADFARLADALAIIDPAIDWVHCDVMDHHFVPDLTFGSSIVGAARRLSRAFVDVHLMIEHPLPLLPDFRKAGADQITIHLESPHDVPVSDVIAAIRATGAKAGLAIKPGTPFTAAEPHLGAIDNLLVMTVEPGKGGQAFMEPMLDKVRAGLAARNGGLGTFRIEVDGGIGPATAPKARDAGADVFVAGHAIYRQPDPLAALVALRAAVA